MTEIHTDHDIIVDGEMPTSSDPAGRKTIDGVWSRMLLVAQVEEREIDFEADGKVLTIAGTTIPELQAAIHEWAVRKEWRGPKAETQRTTGDDIALIVSECAEALEAYRECNDPTVVWYTYTVEVDGVKFKDVTLDQLRVLLQLEPEEDIFDSIEELNLTPKPEGVGPELADTVIRILDYCEEHGLNLLHFLMEKMAHNDTREVRHGGKHL